MQGTITTGRRTKPGVLATPPEAVTFRTGEVDRLVVTADLTMRATVTNCYEYAGGMRLTCADHDDHAQMTLELPKQEFTGLVDVAVRRKLNNLRAKRYRAKRKREAGKGGK